MMKVKPCSPTHMIFAVADANRDKPCQQGCHNQTALQSPSDYERFHKDLTKIKNFNQMTHPLEVSSFRSARAQHQCHFTTTEADKTSKAESQV